MNQSILFPNNETWNESLQQVEFPAQSMGALITCVVPLDVLERVSGITLHDSDSALEQFCQYRFDIEELAEEQIEDENFNSEGQVVLR
jgi:hypothetical protein